MQGLAYSRAALALLFLLILLAMTPYTLILASSTENSMLSSEEVELSSNGVRYYYSAAIAMALEGKYRAPTILKEVPERILSTETYYSPAVGETIFSTNYRVTEDTGIPFETEPSIAANPLNPDNLVVAAHQESTEYIRVYVGLYHSEDGGETWEGPILAVPYNETYDWLLSDPALTSDSKGNFYLAYLSVGYRPVGNYYYYTVFTSTIMLGVSSDGGKTWEFHPAVTPDYIDVNSLMMRGFYPDVILLDKEYIASGPYVFNKSMDILVVSYTEFVEGYDYITYDYITNITIRVSVSLDGGKTWSEPVAVSPTVTISSRQPGPPRVIQGSYPAVGPNGTIYIAYYDSGEDGWLEGSARIMVVKSTDGGKTWSKPKVAAVIPKELDYYYTALGFSFFRWWSSMFPVITVGPDGVVYIVYAADPDGDGCDPADVFLVYSKDGGETWSQPINLSNDAGSCAAQFFPWIDVDPYGVAHIAWGDTRLAPEGLGYDVFYANFSYDGGEYKIYRVTDYTSSVLDVWGFIGDYFNLIATSKNVHVVWTDARRAISKIDTPVPIYRYGNLDIFTAKIGSRASPYAEPELVTLKAGQGAFLNLKFGNLPRDAYFITLLNGTVLEGISTFVTSDSEGKASVKMLFPALGEGLYTIQVVNPITGSVYAETLIKVVDYTAIYIQELNGSVSDLREYVEALSSGVDALGDRIGSLEGRVSAIEGSLSTLQSQVDSLSSDVASISSDVQEIKSGQAALEDRVISIEGTVSEIKQKQEMQSQQLSDISGKLDSLSSKVASISDALQSLSTKLDSIADKVAKAIDTAGEAVSKAQSNMYVSASALVLILIAIAAIFLKKS